MTSDNSTAHHSRFPIYPSLLAFDFSCLREQVVRVEAAGAAGLHLDIMDGQFVPNLTFGPLVAAALRRCTALPVWAHLMVYTPEALIKPLGDAGVSRLYLHPESTPHIHRALTQVKNAGLEAGVAINPGTPVMMLEPLLGLVDGVLIMSVNPGFGGQPFIPASVGRVRELCALLTRLGVSPSVECDGGVDARTVKPLAQAGMTGAVIGTALFENDQRDPVAGLRAIEDAVCR